MTLRSGQDGDFTNGEIYEYTASCTGERSHTAISSPPVMEQMMLLEIPVLIPDQSVKASSGGGGGGGGGGSSFNTIALNGLVSVAPLQVNSQGIIQSSSQLKTTDGKYYP